MAKPISVAGLELLTNPIPIEALKHHIGIVGKTGSGKSYATQGIAELLCAEGARVCIIDPTDRYWGLRLNGGGKKPSGIEPVIIGGSHADLPLATQHGAMLAEIAGTTSTPMIIVTRELTVEHRTRFFTDFAETLLRKNSGPLHLVIDEAHLFMPQAGARVGGSAPAMLHAGNNLVSLGRGAGLRIMLLTQRPAKLHKDALTQVECLVAFRLIAPQDRNAIREWVREWADDATAAEMMSTLPSLETGKAWIWAPELDVLRAATFPAIATFDSGQAQTGPAIKTAPIDLSALRGQLEHIVAAAVENDPKRLKARIAELEKQLGAKTTVDPAALLAAMEEGIIQGRAQMSDQIAEMQAGISAAMGHLARIRRDGQGAATDIVIPPAPRPKPIEHQPPPARRLESGTADLGFGERKVLIAIAQDPDGVDREQIGVLTAYKASSRNTYISRLRNAGYVVELGGLFFSTPSGDAALGDFERLPRGDALREYWLQRLPDGERKILEAVISTHPRGIERSRLDELTKYKASSRNTYLSRLGTRKLIQTAGSIVTASPHLFS